MKSVIHIIVFIMIGWIASSFLPYWWIIACVAFLTALGFRMQPGKGFFHLFIGGIILWGGMAMFVQLGTHSDLTELVASIFGIGSGSILIFLIALIGGLLGGLAGWSGASLNRLIRPKNG